MLKYSRLPFNNYYALTSYTVDKLDISKCKQKLMFTRYEFSQTQVKYPPRM